MYKVAIVQNESEMMRYGWADVRPSIKRLGYSFDGYTGENIEQLFPLIDENVYDAVLITANACSNTKIINSLRNHRETSMTHLLNNRKGVFVSYQAKMSRDESFGFLPTPYDIRSESRSREEEATSTGIINIPGEASNHSIVAFPNIVNVSEITNQCLHNNLVQGIYWAHILPINPGIYNPILIDSNYEPNRSILVTTREDLQSRIVISTLVVDWQGHDKLWENLVRYIVEGKPSIAIVSKKGSLSKDFRYLTSTVDIKRLAAAKYEQRELSDLSKIPSGVHDVLVLDPSWSEREIQELDNKQRLLASFSRVFYFKKSPQGDVILNAISNLKDFHRISQNALTWLIASYTESTKPYWGGSFWTTIDVLRTLKDFERPITQYSQRIIPEVEKHDVDGSYDEVIGATCGLLELYFWFYGKNNPKYKRTLEWLLMHFPGKAVYEKASALDVIIQLGEEVSQKEILNLKNEIMSSFQSLTNEFALHRYIKSLLSCKFVNEAEQLALSLQPLQNIADGSWINVSNTASTVLTLIDLQNSINHPNPTIDEMIFRGILFVKSSYSESTFCWDEDPLATALSLKALRAFEEQIEFPVDELVVSLEAENIYTRNLIAIDAATRMNVALQENYNQLNDQLEELRMNLEKETHLNIFAKRLSLISTTVMMVTISIGLIFAAYLIRNQIVSEAWDFFLSFASDFALVIIPSVALIPLIFIGWLLRKYGMLPTWVDDLLSKTQL